MSILNSYLVRVSCKTYNQSVYITDALNGFCMQQTDFPFVCTIIDDASTDGEQDVIKNYLQEHFDLEDPSIVKKDESDDCCRIFARHKTNENCYFAVILLKYNHYRKKAKYPYYREWADTKYLALCEGDDYWTDPLKLQMQVDFLEANEHISMCCTDSSIRTSDGESRWPHYNENRLAAVEDVILFGLDGRGVCFQTATIVYRRSLFTDKSYPKFCSNCHVGDYPLMLWAAMNGGIYYLNKTTAVYRWHSEGSWTKRQQKTPVDKKIPGWRSEIDMLKGLDVWSQGIYSASFRERISSYLFGIIRGNIDEAEPIMSEFHDELNLLNRRQRLFVFVLKHFPRTLFFVKKVRNMVKKRNR